MGDRMILQAESVRNKYAAALQGLAANCKLAGAYSHPVLFEGGGYDGIWLECGPLEGLVYGKHAPDIARACHEVFFHHQREDGCLPFVIKADKPRYAAIQMVVPIAATAYETFEQIQDEAFLLLAYDACCRWDAWLARNRDTRGTGLCELFCQWDTGHDASPRIKTLPVAALDTCPRHDGLPYLAPDLSATVHGGRTALAKMAGSLGKSDEAADWAGKAEKTRLAILKHCYDPEDDCFYDVDTDGNFIRIRSDIISRVLGEHVVDQHMFDRIYERHIRNPRRFWTPYPLPSIAADDPAFVKPIPQNSWGGASQALTALRAPRWFEHYGRSEDLKELMTKWVGAIVASPHFMQQIDPWTGVFTESKCQTYSPAMCVLIDFVDRLGLLQGVSVGY